MRAIAISLQINQSSIIAAPYFSLYTIYTFYMATIFTFPPPLHLNLYLNLLAPRRSAIGRNDALASLQRLRHNQTKILAQRRQHQHIAPLPHLLLLLAKYVGDDFNAETQRRRVISLLYLPYSFFKILQPFQRMPPTKIKKVYLCASVPLCLCVKRIPPRYTFYTFCTVQIEKAFYVHHLNRRTTLAEVRLNPPLLRLARCNDPIASPQKPSLNRADQPLLPPMIPKPHRIITRLRHPLQCLLCASASPR